MFRLLNLPAYKAFADQYARAREASADADADDIGHISRQAADGEIEPAAARAAIDGLKWSAGKRKPKKYGDKVALVGGGADDDPIRHQLDPSNLTDEQLAALAGILGAAPVAGGGPGGDSRGGRLTPNAGASARTPRRYGTAVSSLAGFVKEAWHVLEPTNPLKWSWHLDAMCAHLEAISRGQMTPWLIINVPPGSSKSMIVSVCWQAWEWGPLGKPSSRFLTTSFEEENVKRDTRKTRDLVKSEWFKMLWPDVVLTRAGETSFANSATGTREGVPFASITGKRGDKVVIDDPHSPRWGPSQTSSETRRRAASSRAASTG